MSEVQEQQLIQTLTGEFEQLIPTDGREEHRPVLAEEGAEIDRLQFRLNVMEHNYSRQQAQLARMEDALFDTRLFAAIDTTAAQKVVSIFTSGQPVIVTEAGDVDWPRYAGEAALVMGLITFMSYLKSILPEKKTEEPVIIRDDTIRFDGPNTEEETTTVIHTFGGKP